MHLAEAVHTKYNIKIALSVIRDNPLPTSVHVGVLVAVNIEVAQAAGGDEEKAALVADC